MGVGRYNPYFQDNDPIQWKGSTVKQGILVGIVVLATGAVWAAPIADPGSRGVDWAKVKVRVETQPWAKTIVSGMKANVATTQNRYAEPPLGESGWFHDYYCPRMPGGWSSIGKSRRSIDARDAGRFIAEARMTMSGGGRCRMRSSRRSGRRRFCIGSRARREYLDYARGKLLWYANHYEQYPPHGKHAGKGRIGHNRWTRRRRRWSGRGVLGYLPGDFGGRPRDDSRQAAGSRGEIHPCHRRGRSIISTVGTTRPWGWWDLRSGIGSWFRWRSRGRLGSMPRSKRESRTMGSGTRDRRGIISIRSIRWSR